MLKRAIYVLSISAMWGCHPRGAFTSDAVAQPRSIVDAQYPHLLLSAGVEGDVIVDVAIDSAGHVDHARTKKVKSPHDFFTMSVMRAIDTTNWRPARQMGQPVPSVRRDTFSFVLKRDSSAACPKSSEHHRRICGVSITVERRSVS